MLLQQAVKVHDDEIMCGEESNQAHQSFQFLSIAYLIQIKLLRYPNAEQD